MQQHQYGHADVVHILLDSGMDVNALGGTYSTALQAASARNHKRVVEILLDAGANVNIEGGILGTAFLVATATGNVDIVQVLISAGANTQVLFGETSVDSNRHTSRISHDLGSQRFKTTSP